MFYLFNPCADTFICLTVFIDFVEWKTYELAINDSDRRIECITGCVHRSTEFAARIFQFFIKNTDSITERIAVRIGITTTEQGYIFVRQIAFL